MHGHHPETPAPLDNLSGSGQEKKAPQTRAKHSKRSPTLADRSARIKRLFIELHDYAFFHNPSEIGQVDYRFVGRESILNRLRVLLTSHQTRSGAYLVTGYRGAGKSSLVAKALSDISSGERRPRRASRYFRILLPLPILALLNLEALRPWLPFPWLHFHLPLFVAFAAILFLSSTDPRLPDLYVNAAPSRWLWLVRFLWQLARYMPLQLVMELDSHPRRRPRRITQDMLFVLLIHILAAALALLFWGGTPLWFNRWFVTYSCSYAILVLWIALTTLAQLHYRTQRHGSWRGYIKYAGDRAFKLIHNNFNFSHRIHIQINLGQDDLSELDILRLIARNVYTKYMRFRKRGFTGVWWRLVLFSSVYLVVAILYYSRPIYEMNQQAKLASHFYAYFPSQISPFLQDGPKSVGDALKEVMKKDSDLSDPWEELGQASIEQPPVWAALPANNLGPEGKVGLKRIAVLFTSYVDLFLFRAYQAVYSHLLSPLNVLAAADQPSPQKTPLLRQPLALADAFRLLPASIDYFFLCYLIAGWLALRAGLRFPPFGMVTHSTVLRQLRDLNQSIDAQITRTTSASSEFSGRGVKFERGATKQATYPMAGIREIEKRLLEILDAMERIPRVTVRPSFVFVFDELDKIEPHKNLTLAQEEEEFATPAAGPDSGGRSYGAMRERQGRVLQLLSNLKHFFSTAKAKFIFIAGREMFDAALADVSDRHFFMGSIFNDVINVPSFLRDSSDRRLGDPTSLTEAYVCQFLVPPGYEKSLRGFQQYLERKIFKERGAGRQSDGSPAGSTNGDSDGSPEPRLGEGGALSLERQRREKAFAEVLNLIVYLTYRSNGAPKKITRLFEAFIVPATKEELTSDLSLCVGRSSRSLYLELGFYDQYRTGLVSYLANPLLFSLNRENKDLGDKLLVSSSFVLDHLYKFHGSAFSWRSLELLPEIVDVNKAPQLREVIGEILEFCSSTHIERISSGLHDFRFRSKITEEISFLSRVSESESAAFNFTLDESLPVKQFHNHRLRQLVSSEESGARAARGDAYVHSVGFLRMILGDLHFYDGEFDQAILEYMEAAQVLQNLPEEQRPERAMRTLVLLVRNLLKLGLAFEKKRTYDSAFVLYGELTALITSQRNIDLKGVGLPPSKVRQLTGRSMAKRKRVKKSDGELLDAALATVEFSPELERLAYKRAAFEGVGLLYEPFLAKLQIIEKANLGGISASDLQRCEDEFRYLFKMLSTDVHFQMQAEFRNKLGDILFFKNGPRPGVGSHIYCRSKEARCAENTRVEELWDRGLRTPCWACLHYMGSLETLCSAVGVIDQPKRSLVQSLLRHLIGNSRAFALRNSALRAAGNLLSDVGDTFLSCAVPRRESLSQTFILELLSVIEEHLSGRSAGAEPPAGALSRLEKFDWLRSEARPLTKTEETLVCFALSSVLYKAAGEHKSHSHQLTKVLYVIREAAALGVLVPRKSDAEGMVARVEDVLVKRVIRGLYRTYESIHRIEIAKLQSILESKGRPRYRTDAVFLNHVSISREFREVVVVLEEVKLELQEDYIARRKGRWFVSPYSVVNSMYNRIHELRYRVKLNFRCLAELCGERNSLAKLLFRKAPARGTAGFAKKMREFDEVLERANEKGEEMLGYLDTSRNHRGAAVVVHLITDSIFCLHELVRCLRVFGLSYMANHSMRASAHDKLAQWCEAYYNYLKYTEKTQRSAKGRRGARGIEETLVKLIGESELATITPQFHKDRAVSHYRAAIQTHTEGRAYKRLLEHLYYLDDDTHDELIHFCAAIERYRINSNAVSDRINELAEEIKGTQLHQSENYYRPKDVT